MRPTLADYMRNNALKMESAELAPVTEIVAPVTIPDGVEERSRDHLILLPSPGVASSVEVGTGEGDDFQPLTEEQIGVSTVSGDDATASAIVVRDRKLAGELRIRYVPVDVAMEDADKPFVQLGTVVEPGSENKNPFPANAPTEEPAPQVTNQPTVDNDKGDLEDKAKIAENAVDQSVAPKVEVTVVEKGGEDANQDDGKVVDANDGNTGERKAEETAAENELKGPKEEKSPEDDGVANAGGDDATQDAAKEDEANTEGTAASEETPDGENAENNDTDDEDEEDEEEEELKTESFNLIVLIDEAVALTMEDGEEDKKPGMVTRVWKALAALVTRIRKWLEEKVFSKLRKKKRADDTQAAKDAMEAVEKMRGFTDEEHKRLSRNYTLGVREIEKYDDLMHRLATLTVHGREDADHLRSKIMAAVNTGNSKAYAGLISEVEDLFNKFHVGAIFDVKIEDADGNIGNKLRDELNAKFKDGHREPSTELWAVMKSVYKVQFDYSKRLDVNTNNAARKVASLSGEIERSKGLNGLEARENSAELIKLAKYFTVFENACMAAYSCSSIIEAGMIRFVHDVLSVVKSDELTTESYKIVDENKEDEAELVQLSFEIDADVKALDGGYVAEADEKKGLLARMLENLSKFIAKIKAWLNEKVFSKIGKAKREAELKKSAALAERVIDPKTIENDLLKELDKHYTVGIKNLTQYAVVMEQFGNLATAGQKELNTLCLDAYMSLGKGVEKSVVSDLLKKFEQWFSKYYVESLFPEADSPNARADALMAELRKTFNEDKAGRISANELRSTADNIYKVLTAYTKKLNGFSQGTHTTLKATVGASDTYGDTTSDADIRKVVSMMSAGFVYVKASLSAGQIIENALKSFTMAAGDMLDHAEAKGKETLKTEGFSQPVEILTAPSDVSPIVIPAEKPFLPESLVITREVDENQLVILREDKVRVRTNEDGLGEAFVVVDPALQGQIQANYTAVVAGELPAMEDGEEDPVVTLDVITDDRDGVEIRVAQMVDGDTEEPIPEELVELRAEGAIALEAHENCIKGLSSVAYMVDMANAIKFEGDVQATELVMEGMLDSIKGAMTRLGNWLDKSMKYQKVWDINWNQTMAHTQKEIRNARASTASADVVKLNRVVRNLTINGQPVTDIRELQRQLAEIAKLGNDAKAHMVAVGNLYEDVRRLIAKHDNVNPDGAAILKEIPALVKKVNLRPWASLIKGERQVSEKSVERIPSSAPYLGDVVVAERQSLNDLTYANPDKALREMLEKTYVGYRTDWELDRDLTGAEMKVLTPQEMEGLLNAVRKASEAWDLYSTIVATGKKMDAFYRSLWSLKQYDRDFLSAYGVIIAADQWAYHPVLDLRFDFAYPMQAVLRLISINAAVYK